MRKLFFYLALFGYLFWAAFCLTEDYFSNRTEAIRHDKIKLNATINIKTDMETHNQTEYCATFVDHILVIIDQQNHSVFETTNLTDSDIQKADKDLYNRIIDGIYFHSTEEIYIFLEAVSS
ncbi:MAG: hypothetical protein Q4D54_05555 [Eubacteriales bacterium]|nr:hypothetical protein [Lachnospiraceae bacterium]MDO5127199.1 hypothetical protein [Eubacteriales bacterium]